MQGGQSTTWLNFIIAFAPVIVGLIGVTVGYYFSKKTLQEKKMEDERKEIYKKLNSFYGPFQQLRGRSKILYDSFALEQKRQDPNFRTLVALVEGVQFTGNDKALLDRIMDLTKQADQLIIERSGLVEDPELRDLLQQVGAHWYYLQLAYNGEISGQPDHYRNYVFPRKIDDMIESRIVTLQKRLDELNS